MEQLNSMARKIEEADDPEEDEKLEVGRKFDSYVQVVHFINTYMKHNKCVFVCKSSQGKAKRAGGVSFKLFLACTRTSIQALQ